MIIYSTKKNAQRKHIKTVASGSLQTRIEHPLSAEMVDFTSLDRTFDVYFEFQDLLALKKIVKRLEKQVKKK
jgi:hypothetical protein